MFFTAKLIICHFWSFAHKNCNKKPNHNSFQIRNILNRSWNKSILKRAIDLVHPIYQWNTGPHSYRPVARYQQTLSCSSFTARFIPPRLYRLFTPKFIRIRPISPSLEDNLCIVIRQCDGVLGRPTNGWTDGQTF